MRTRTFGATTLETSEIAFGTWALGSDWWGETDEPDHLIGRALELGITFFDTGDAYGQGVNEEIVGRALARSDRDSIQISTKFGYELDSERREHAEGERRQNWSAGHAGAPSSEASTASAPTTWTSTSSITRGWTGFARTSSSPSSRRCATPASCGTTGSRWDRPSAGARRASRRSARARPRHSRPSTTCSSRSPGTRSSTRPWSPERGSWRASRPRAGCSRTSTRSTTFSGNDHRRHRKREWLVEGVRKVEQLRFLVIPGERTMTQAALQFVLAQPGMACVVPTVTSVSEIEELAGASTAPPLTQAELERIDALYARGFDLEPARA